MRGRTAWQLQLDSTDAGHQGVWPVGICTTITLKPLVRSQISFSAKTLSLFINFFLRCVCYNCPSTFSGRDTCTVSLKVSSIEMKSAFVSSSAMVHVLSLFCAYTCSSRMQIKEVGETGGCELVVVVWLVMLSN